VGCLLRSLTILGDGALFSSHDQHHLNVSVWTETGGVQPCPGFDRPLVFGQFLVHTWFLPTTAVFDHRRRRSAQSIDECDSHFLFCGIHECLGTQLLGCLKM
jgi:hypothetical protein